MELKSEFISDGDVTLIGAPIAGGRKDNVRLLLTLTEFKGLGDPMIIGMPTIDRYGRLATIRRHVWLAGVWIPRYFPPKCSKWSPEHPQFKRTQAIQAITLDEMDNHEPSCNFSCRRLKISTQEDGSMSTRTGTLITFLS